MQGVSNGAPCFFIARKHQNTLTSMSRIKPCWRILTTSPEVIGFWKTPQPVNWIACMY
jgi:hypothetical protein